MKIIQILKEGATVYGLGDDNNVYMWGYKYRTWLPTWEETEVVGSFLGDSAPRQNPGR